jgi:predicted CXXCH cytochrome family protein
MRQFLVFFTILLMIGVSGVSYAQITGSVHDFSIYGWSGGQMCNVCHTPHSADVSVANAPLWNHEVTTATYTVYNSPTLDATDLAQPDAASKLCLSCHDGTVAIDSYGGNTGTNFITGADSIGIDLSDDHPVTFTYDDALATTDPGLHMPSVTLTGLGGTIQNDLLFNNSLECASCHDVHNSVPNPSLLRISNANSAICLTCHNK